MKVFTLERGRVEEGVQVENFTLKGAKITVPSVKIGEEGRGRIQGILNVQLQKHEEDTWKEQGKVRIHSVEVGETRAGKPKLISRAQAQTKEQILCVLRTPIGFRGGNAHTGEGHKRYVCELPYEVTSTLQEKNILLPEMKKYTKEEMELLLKEYEEKGVDLRSYVKDAYLFDPFPGKILSSGVIAQGDAGRMGSGDQHVAIVNKGDIVRTSYSGRLYGAPSSHYYLWDGEQLLSATREEREVSDIF